MIYNLVGRRFGRLLVVSKTEKRARRKIVWSCRCACGKEKEVPTDYLTSGDTKSCGCLWLEIIKKANTKHGDCKRSHKNGSTRLHTIWNLMRARCSNKKYHAFHRYGGRGIRVCLEWMKYVSFRTWALANGYQDNLTIHRIDNDKGYCPKNCQWITGEENTKKRFQKKGGIK